MLALFRVKFTCILAVSNPVFRWESCKGSVWESVKNAQDCAKKQRIAIRSHGWLAACKPLEVAHMPSMPEVEISCQLEHYRTKSTDWLFSYLTAGTCDSVKPRVQAANQFCFEKLDSSHSILTLINIPYTHEM